VNSSSRGHHHSSSDGVDGVGGEARNDSNNPSEEEVDEESTLRSKNQRFESIIETEVKTSVDEDSDSGNDKSSVKTSDSVRGEGLSVDIDEPIELAGAVLGFAIVGQSSSSEVERVDYGERQGSGESTRGNVCGELRGRRSIGADLEQCFDGIFEGKVEGLGREISDDIGQVSSPEGADSLRSDSSLGAVNDSVVRPVEGSLFDHFSLVLDQEFDSLDGGGTSF